MKMSLPVLSTVLVALVTLPTTLFAHEGHGLEATMQGFHHWASSPIHVTMLVVGGAVLLGIVLVACRRVLGLDSAARSSDTRCAEG